MSDEKCDGYGCVSGTVWEYDEHGHTTGATSTCDACSGTGSKRIGTIKWNYLEAKRTNRFMLRVITVGFFSITMVVLTRPAKRKTAYVFFGALAWAATDRKPRREE